MFSKSTYVARRAQLKKQFRSGLLLFLGNVHSPINYQANVYPFRQDSSFLYFFGLDQPGLAAVIDLDQDREIIFGDEPTAENSIWFGQQIPLAERCQTVGVRQAESLADLKKHIKAAVKIGQTVHFLPPYRAENTLQLSGLLDISPAALSREASIHLIRAVVAQRSHKSNEELAEIEKAVNVTRRMQLAAVQRARPGLMERDLVGVMTEICLASGCAPAFPVILTTQGHILHNETHFNELKDGDLVINDSGAESPLHYAGDITRTFPVSGRFTTQQKEIYQIVLTAQTEAISAIKPGVPFRDVHLKAAECLTAGLKELGLMKDDPNEAVRAGAHALFFPCGLGHFLGLDVHDMEDLGEDFVGYNEGELRSEQFGLKSLRLARALETGFVLTVEPGLYFIPRLIDQWRAEKRLLRFLDYSVIDKFKHFTGVRLEDDVVVTPDGCRTLGEPIPRTIVEIEDLASFGN